MHLKSLEIQGFKSFPDKIKLEFGKGLTAVVGPNGSGKSNIGDAVRWVLGEQSSKNLRGNKMEDVIFSGTQYRKSVGFAQVTLNIENTDGILQVPAEEVSITRKLYRSGESEYMINGSQVRLKDVCELFMDTGLGRDGYSIIGQGKVAEIISAKSNERRMIFEEAAGISKFRYKKAEAERKLAAAEDNILRLRDILNELELRVEPLKIQSEKAYKFIEYSEKKKVLEVSVWIMKLDELSKTLSELEDKILLNNAQYENFENDISSIENKIQQIYQMMQESSIKVDGLQNSILNEERRKSALQSEIAVCRNDILHSENSIKEIEEKQRLSLESEKEINRKIEFNNKQISEALEEKKRTSDEIEIHNENISKLNLETDSFDNKYEEANKKLNSLYLKQSEYNFSIKSHENTLVDLKNNLDTYISAENDLNISTENLRAESQEISEAITAVQNKQEQLVNKLSGYTKLYEKKSEKLSEVKKQYENCIFSFKEKEQKIKLLTDLERSMEGYYKSVREIIKIGRESQIKGIRGSIGQLISVDSKYSLAIETALGSAIQNIAVENEETAKRCIRLLKERNAGRATFLPLTSVKGNAITDDSLRNSEGFVGIAFELVEYDKEYDGIVKSLLGRIVICEDIDFASLMAKKYSYKYKIVTLDGQVINAGGSFTGGSSVQSSGVLTRKNEIEKLKKEARLISEKTELYKSDYLKLLAENEKMLFDIEALKEEKALIQSDMYKFSSEQKRIFDMLQQCDVQKEGLISQILSARQRIEDTEKLDQKTKELLNQCRLSIEENEKIVSNNQEKLSNVHEQREEISKVISELKIKQMDIQKNIEISESVIKQLEESRTSISQTNTDNLQKISELHNIIHEKYEQITEKESEINSISEEIKNIKDNISVEQENHRSLEKSAYDYRSELQKTNEEKEKFSREITRFTERKSSVQKDYDDIISQMLEQYQMTRSEAISMSVPLEDTVAAQKELNDLKSRIRSLGNVNVAAIEEYKEVSERYKFMSEQLNDVVVSKNELEKLIKELTEDMRKLFSECFEQINCNFKSIFIELFGGGKAELLLTEPDDILESGIDIIVAPPGKVINNLSLLSGGEQAFVAIAIYFAILKIKPAPFCILDEIEAALDDVNVSKYASYLRNFTGTTQFILITHRRGTMEEADVLYGVTMQEKGISKLLKMEQLPAEKGDL